MPSRIVKQPNGLYACFSTIVDNFTAYGMTQTEAYELCREKWAFGMPRPRFNGV